MQQSLQFLQAAALELQSLVQQEIEINPVLEEATDDVKTSVDNDDSDLPADDIGNVKENNASEADAKESASNDDPEWDRELDELRRNDEDWRDYYAQSNSTSGYSAEADERRKFLFDER